MGKGFSTGSGPPRDFRKGVVAKSLPFAAKAESGSVSPPRQSRDDPTDTLLPNGSTESISGQELGNLCPPKEERYGA
jgi:hypothetical protein